MAISYICTNLYYFDRYLAMGDTRVWCIGWQLTPQGLDSR